MDGFASRTIRATGAEIAVHTAGSGPAVVLLHGFPETHLMWRDVAAELARDHLVICADLRGYGASSCPPSAADHEPYSKRAMARDIVDVADELGLDRFAVVGHDRGGRVAYRAALDHPERVSAVAVLDVVPVEAAWEHADDRFALAFWPWSLLAQDAPLPERLLAGSPEAVLDHALSDQWGTPAATFGPDVRAAYLAVLSDPEHVHAICEEYRAAATIDRDHDREDLRAGRSITCPLLALWSRPGPLGSWYAELGGPVALWRRFATRVSGEGVDGGHFFPEERPLETARRLTAFLRGAH